MKTFFLPITYKVAGFVPVQAESLGEAVSSFRSRFLTPPQGGRYVSNSMALDHDSPEKIAEVSPPFIGVHEVVTPWRVILNGKHVTLPAGSSVRVQRVDFENSHVLVEFDRHHIHWIPIEEFRSRVAGQNFLNHIPDGAQLMASKNSSRIRVEP